MATAAKPPPPCPLPHLPEGYQAVPIGMQVVDPEQWQQLIDITTNANAKTAAAVERERTVQLQARADAVTLATEQSKTAIDSLKGQLEDARAEIRSRGQENDALIRNRREDLTTLAQ